MIHLEYPIGKDMLVVDIPETRKPSEDNKHIVHFEHFYPLQ